MPDADAESSAPIEEQIPPAVIASPGEVRAAPEDIVWWRPSWQDAVEFVGWRWLFLAPAVVLLLLLAGAIFFQRWRVVLFILGVKLLGIVAAIAFSLAGYVVKRAARARTEPFCIHCGYCLTGLPDNYRCPECGRPYTWRVIQEYRRDPQWFIERWKLQQNLPSAYTPIDALPSRRSRRGGDGTE